MQQKIWSSCLGIVLCLLIASCSANEHVSPLPLSSKAETSNSTEPKQTSTNKPSSSPVDTPILTPASAPVDTPILTPASAPVSSPLPTKDPVQLQLENMSLEEKIGQLFIFGFDGTSMTETTKAMIETYKIGGFILYKHNIQDIDQLGTLLKSMKETNNINSQPLWLSVDEEGGKVHRLPSEFKNTPSAKKIGDKNDASNTFHIGQTIGSNLHQLGFNMNFAPVLDINSNSNNPVIGDRAFGDTVETVTTHGLMMMKGISSEGVAAVVKHFPGHGDTSVDSHKALPYVDKTLAQLEQFELLPFKEAILQKVDAIMIAHLLMLQLDPKNPASISSVVINDLLRTKLEYKGVVITDDMTMGGLVNGNKMGDAAVKSIMAGTDIILVGHNSTLQIEAYDAIKNSIHNGEITMSRLEESVSRIIRLKQKYDLDDIVH